MVGRGRSGKPEAKEMCLELILMSDSVLQQRLIIGKS